MRLKSLTIIESVVAMLLIVLVFSMITDAILSISKSNNIGKEIQLYNILKQKATNIKSDNQYIDKSYIEDGVIFSQKVERLIDCNELILIHLTAKDAAVSSKVVVYEELIRYEDL